MRNLKRILSLAMASIMLVGMMAISASAVDFPDSDKIENTDAVNTMVALGIIKGKDDGNFDPEGIVTRAEMAKMICVAMNGGKDPNLSGAGLYPDTKGHWAAGYIDYCTNLGIVSGDNKGNFNPNATITGVEAAKMILIAIGYNAENEKYVNDANWDTNIGVDASTKDLYKDVAINPMEGLTRDNAAQMLWNGMQATMVEYDYKVGAVDGNVTSIAIAKDRDNKTILTEKFSMDTDIIILTSVKKDNKDTYTLNGTKVDAKNSRFTKVENDVSSLLGQEVKVLYKDTDKVYGVYATNNNDVVEAYQKDISKDGAKKVKIDGTSYELESCTFITDGEVGAAATSTNLVDEASFNSVKLIDNDGDDKYEYAVVTVVKPVKVSYISSTEIIAGGETYKDKDNDIADGLKKGDYVTVTYSIGGDNYSIVKMEQQEGKISGYKAGSTNDQYKIDGDWYTVAGKVSGITGAGKTITFCAVNGVIVKDTVEATDSSTLDNVAMILASDPATAVNRNVKIMLADGTKKNVSLDKFVDADNKTKTVSADDAVGTLYTYSVTDNGYKFKDIGNVGDFKWTAGVAGDVLDKANSTSGNVLTLGKTTKFAIADDAKIFVYLNNDAKILTGKQVKNLAITTAIATQSLGFFTGEVGGIDRVVVGALTAVGSLPEGKDEASNYALVVEDSYIEDEDYVTYKIWDGSDVVTVREKDTAAVRKQMTVIAYSALDGDVIKDVTVPAGLTKGAVKGLLGDEISFDGVLMNKLDKDTVYMYYDSSAEDAEEIGVRGADRDIVVLADKVEDVYVENVKYVLNSDGTVAFILVDSKNKLADATSYDIPADSAPANTTWDLPTSAKAGELVKVTITPNSGYHLTTAGTATVTDATFVSDIVIKDGVATFTFVMPAKDITAVSATTVAAADAP